MTSVPRHFDVRRMFAAIEARLGTLERGQRSTAQLAARVTELEARVAALDGKTPGSG